MSGKTGKIKYASLLIALASALWGVDGVVLTPRLYGIPVLPVVFILHALPFVIMNFFWFPKYRLLRQFGIKEWGALVLVSIFGGALGTMAIVKALFLVHFKQLSVVVLLQKFQPVFALLLSYFLLKEKLSVHFFKYALLAIIAGYFLTFGWSLPGFDTGDHTLQAALLSLFAAFAFGSSTVFSKHLLTKIDFTGGTFLRYGTTAVLLLPVVVFGGYWEVFGEIQAGQWWILLIIALTTGSGAILLYYYGLKNVKASVSTVMELMFPVTAVFLDYWVNGNLLSPVQWLSGIVMIWAIYRISVSGDS